MEQLINKANAHEINRLWSEIYCLWKEENELDGVSEKNSNKVIDIFSELLELIDKEKDPHGYCILLRMRAQNYCLKKKYDDALRDLRTERDFINKYHDLLRIKKCEELISKISDWRGDVEGKCW